MKARRAAALFGLAVLTVVSSAAQDEPALRVVFSKNVELFSVLANLTPNWRETEPHGGPAVEARTRFLPHRGHDAVGMTRTLLRHRNRNSLMRLALRLSDFPEARTLDPSVPLFSRVLLARAIPVIRAFSRAAAFEEFWEGRDPILRAWAAQADEALAGVPVIGTLEGFFGTEKAEYRMVFAPQMDRLRTGDLRTTAEGEQATVIFGPREGVSDGVSPADVRGLVVDVAFLEFGRIWVTDILDRNPGEARKHASLQDRAARRKGRDGPAKPWRSFWIDNLTAAVQARLVARVYGNAAGSDVLVRSHADDILAPEISSVLEAYERDRTRFPALGSFLKELMARLEVRLGARSEGGLP